MTWVGSIGKLQSAHYSEVFRLLIDQSSWGYFLGCGKRSFALLAIGSHTPFALDDQYYRAPMCKSVWYDTLLRKRLTNGFGPVRSPLAHNDSFFIRGEIERQDLIPRRGLIWSNGCGGAYALSCISSTSVD